MSELALGKIIETEQWRDAIHVAVAPVTAAEDLEPGERVGLNEAGGACKSAKAIGIVDPFLEYGPYSGQRFWLFLFPNTVTGMRHHWKHPAFSEPSHSPSADESTEWIKNFAARIDQTVSRLMDAAELWVDTHDGKYGGEYTYDNSEKYKECWDEFPEFWKHWEVVTGRKAPGDDDCFYMCSC